MAIITVDKASLAFGSHSLLNKVNFSLEKGEKFGLIGRNGSGKSSFLKALAGNLKLDDGQVFVTNGTKIVYVPQEPILDPKHTIYEEVFAAMGSLKDSFIKYERTLDLLEKNTDANEMELLLHELNILQEELDRCNLWSVKSLIDKTLAELHLDGHWNIVSLSGGVKKRVAIAKALVVEPDVILLDEPTNHLDMTTTLWLESAIRNFPGAIVLITHDRVFLDNTVDKIAELDRGRLSVYPGSYAKYKEWKADQLHNEKRLNVEFDKVLAQEEIWIRKGIQARRTRNEGRVRRLEALRVERQQRRERVGQVKFEVDSGGKSGKIVANLEHVNVAFGDKCILKDFATTVLRGDKIGLIGPNGVGKSTLLKVILGELTPDDGKVELGTKTAVAYFDQFREQLDEDATIQDVVSQGQDYVEVNGRRLHIATYLEEFLFAPDRFRSPVRALSGGERNRLLLARLFSRPANVLVLDEPTNDLDIETLELLEELLANYTGTVFLVSHDREFLDNVVTESLVFRGNGEIIEIAGGYSDWLMYSQNYLQNSEPLSFAEKREFDKTKNFSLESEIRSDSASEMILKKESHHSKDEKKKNKLSYKEKLELESLPAMITALENEQLQLTKELSSGELYKTNPIAASQKQMRLVALEEEVLAKMERWEQLEANL